MMGGTGGLSKARVCQSGREIISRGNGPGGTSEGKHGAVRPAARQEVGHVAAARVDEDRARAQVVRHGGRAGAQLLAHAPVWDVGQLRQHDLPVLLLPARGQANKPSQMFPFSSLITLMQCAEDLRTGRIPARATPGEIFKKKLISGAARHLDAGGKLYFAIKAGQHSCSTAGACGKKHCRCWQTTPKAGWRYDAESWVSSNKLKELRQDARTGPTPRCAWRPGAAR